MRIPRAFWLTSIDEYLNVVDQARMQRVSRDHDDWLQPRIEKRMHPLCYASSPTGITYSDGQRRPVTRDIVRLAQSLLLPERPNRQCVYTAENEWLAVDTISLLASIPGVSFGITLVTYHGCQTWILMQFARRCLVKPIVFDERDGVWKVTLCERLTVYVMANSQRKPWPTRDILLTFPDLKMEHGDPRYRVWQCVRQPTDESDYTRRVLSRASVLARRLMDFIEASPEFDQYRVPKSCVTNS